MLTMINPNRLIALMFVSFLHGILPSHAYSADSRCGAYCLYVALKGLECEVPTFKTFEHSLEAPPKEGYSMAQLGDIAQRYGAHSLGVNTSLDNLALREEPLACLALLKECHFVVISDFTDREVTILDPPRAKTVPVSTLGIVWDGQALLISKRPLALEEEIGDRRRLSYTWGAAAAIALLLVGLAFWVRRRLSPSVALVSLAAAVLSSSGCRESPQSNGEPGEDFKAKSPKLVALSAMELGQVPVSSERQIASSILNNEGIDALRLTHLAWFWEKGRATGS